MSNNQIVYKIRADGKGYVKTLQKMRGDTKKFGTDVKSQMSGISGALKGAFAFAGVSGLRAISQEFVEMSRQARRLGVDAVEFQKLARAAGEFGIKSETLGDAIKDLNVKITDGALGAKSYAEAFALVGLEVEDVKKMTPTEQFYAFSDAIKSAGGNLARFDLDEVNDSMFQSGEFASLGSEKIRELADSYDVLTQAQLNNLESAEKSIKKLTDSFKILVGEIMSRYSRIVKELSDTLDRLDKKAGGKGRGGYEIKQKGVFFDFTPGKSFTLDEDDETEDKPQGLGDDVISPEKLKASAKLKDDILKEESKQLAEQEKRKQALMDDEEKLLDIQKKKLAVEEELADLGELVYEGLATEDQRLKFAKQMTELEELRTAEQKKQLEIHEKIKSIKEAQKEKDDAQAKRDAKALDDELQGEQDIREAIAKEKSDREEIGMDDEQILERRKDELKKMQENITKGVFSGPDEVAQAELNIEGKKTEIATLEQSINDDLDRFFNNIDVLDSEALKKDKDQDTDPQTSIIASSLAAIGGGGGVAAFGTDPILNENKRQSNLLEQLVKLQGGTIEGGGGLEIPEI